MKSTAGSTPIDKKKRAYKRINLAGNILFILIGVSTIAFNYYDTYRKTTIYKKLDMKFLAARTIIEYGTKDFDIRDIVEDVQDGVIKDYTKTINTSEVGLQKVTFELGEGDITKTFTTHIEVVDTKAPIIEFNKATISLYTGTKYDVKSNIKSVRDEIDGNIAYSSTIKEEARDYYKVDTNFNYNKAGTYTVKVTAFDKNGLKTENSYTIKVVNKKVVKKAVATVGRVNTGSYRGKASVDTSSIVATARSLVGYRYVWAGERPETGFDCSGFVKYVFGLHGKYLAHGTYAQARAGQGVARSDIQPGDIILWSFKNNNQPGHSSIYVGGDTIIHAANPKLGVISSSLSAYERNKSARIVAIRRV